MSSISSETGLILYSSVDTLLWSFCFRLSLCAVSSTLTVQAGEFLNMLILRPWRQSQSSMDDRASPDKALQFDNTFGDATATAPRLRPAEQTKRLRSRRTRRTRGGGQEQRERQGRGGGQKRGRQGGRQG